jgi:Conjugal transfer protein TraD
MAEPTQEQIDEARKKVSQAKARLQDLEARANTAKRKLDTRRKIILGGLLLDAALKDDRYAEMFTELMGRISRNNDRRAFKDWSLDQERKA